MNGRLGARFSLALRAALGTALAMAAAVQAQSPLDPVVSQVANGRDHSCAVTTTGAVKCWGDNTYGQLGDGTTVSRAMPVDVFGLGSGVVAVTAGESHTCAVTTSGAVKCWGNNSSGQLGNNDAYLNSSPLPVSVVDAGNIPIGGAVAISAGYAHTCVLNVLGSVECWGNNADGELGPPNAAAYSTTPVTVEYFSSSADLEIPISGVSAIAAGGFHTCALMTSGDLQCWGSNVYGQLGNGEAGGSTFGLDSPFFALIKRVASITASVFHTCAVVAGGVKCWGNDGSGQLGNNDATHANTATPVAVVNSDNTPLAGVSAIAAGFYHGCALTTGGGVKCWGSSFLGELGNATFGQALTPVPVLDSSGSPLAGIAAIAGGGSHTCALTREGGVKCWGRDRSGQVGSGMGDSVPQVVAGLAGGIANIAAGIYHSCAVTTGGGAECWGNNVDGELGNNSNQTTDTPVPVSGLGSGVSAVAVGGYHSCALTTGGGVKCWGFNGSGELGNNDAAHASTTAPVVVVDDSNTPISGVTAVSGGLRHTCALMSGGGVKCWGDNFYGQLGNNTVGNQPAAVSVVNSSNVPIAGATAIAAGAEHTCALTTVGGVLCWGDNSSGELGNNNPGVTQSLTPVTVVDGSNAPITGASSIAAGNNFACVRMSAGGVNCWGYNGQGEIGNGAYSDSYAATKVVVDNSATPLTGVAAVATGYASACAVTTTGAAKCWGDNYYGELGSQSLFGSRVAIPVIDASGTPISGLATNGLGTVAVGASFSCALTTAAGVECWGGNFVGQLGRRFFSYTPTAVVGLSGSVSSITTGDAHTCARTPAGTVKCWGYNLYGQLGNNDSAGANTQAPVSVVDASNRPVTGLPDIAAGADHSCAITPGGGVECWGNNVDGQLGNNDNTGANKLTPAAVVDAGNVPIAGVTTVAAGAFHSCALTSAGRIWCWGYNLYGQLGNNDNALANKYTAVSVVDAANTPVSGATAVAAGGYFNCALFSGGAVKCWGDNSKAQLGMGSTGGQSLIPVAVMNLGSGVASIAAGVFHACAITAAGAAKCWGYNGDGQLGDNSTTTRPVPTGVSGLGSGVAKIAGGQFHTCAVSTAGALTCWGDDSKGQLGINTIGGRSLIPVAVNGLGGGVAAVATGGLHTCALTTVGAVMCWGNNNAGQVGDNSTTTRSVPVGVLNGQSIAFAPPAAAALGSLTLSATASSGLPTTFDSWTPSICTVSGNQVTISTSGLCGVRAAQGGNGSTIAAAPRQLRLIAVSNVIFADGFE